MTNAEAAAFVPSADAATFVPSYGFVPEPAATHVAAFVEPHASEMRIDPSDGNAYGYTSFVQVYGANAYTYWCSCDPVPEGTKEEKKADEFVNDMMDDSPAPDPATAPKGTSWAARLATSPRKVDQPTPAEGGQPLKSGSPGSHSSPAQNASLLSATSEPAAATTSTYNPATVVPAKAAAPRKISWAAMAKNKPPASTLAAVVPPAPAAAPAAAPALQKATEVAAADAAAAEARRAERRANLQPATETPSAPEAAKPQKSWASLLTSTPKSAAATAPAPQVAARALAPASEKVKLGMKPVQSPLIGAYRSVRKAAAEAHHRAPEPEPEPEPELKLQPHCKPQGEYGCVSI